MKCPICNEKVSRDLAFCPNCKANLGENGRTNADILQIFAYINIIIAIIGAIFVWVKFSFITVNGKDVINWFGILGGVGIIISGLTLFFLLRTIVDIFYEIDN